MSVRTILPLLLMILFLLPAKAQKLITYEAGMGTRDPGDPDTWILYRKVKAMHDGITLYADSAHLNTVKNDFTAFRNIKIVISDTTSILGSRLYYDGNEKVAYIWGDTVRLIDGNTLLKSDRLTYDRNSNTGYYDTWGHTVNGKDTIDSREGLYDATSKIIVITENVILKDAKTRLTTDALVYNTITKIATFHSPTNIYSDSTHIYSEQGEYDSDIDYARSNKASHVTSGSKSIDCDTLHYNKQFQFGQAWGHVVIHDTVNDLTCFGRYGETDQTSRTSFITDSALMVYVSDGDSVFLHADTIFVVNDTSNELKSVRAFYQVRMFRYDAQGACDSLFYSAPDSLLTLYQDPILWYDSMQVVADTMILHLDSSGVRLAELNSNMMGIQCLDSDHFNQVKGKQCIIHFLEGEPQYSDILGHAQMVYHLTETLPDSTEALMGINVGIGSNMRIFFHDREPQRVSTYGKPDMTCYPPLTIPEDKKKLQGFEWKDQLRPRSPLQVFPSENK